MSFHTMQTLEQIQASIDENPLVLLYITSHDCGVCHALKPMILATLEKVDADIFPVTASINDMPALSGAYMAFSAPVLILYDHGKEVLREAGILNVSGLADRMRRQLGDV